jgi:hypothetical protein
MLQARRRAYSGRGGGVCSADERKRGESMVKSILKGYPKVAAPVAVRVSEAGGARAGDREPDEHASGASSEAHTLWGADEKNLVLLGEKDGFPSPRSIPWRNVKSLEITLSE